MILSDKKILQKQNRLILSTLFFIFIIMLSLSYASVPLYDLFCKVTGFGGTPQISSINDSAFLDDMISIRLDANTGTGLNWTFYPEKNIHKVYIGEDNLVNYFVENNSDFIVAGTSVFNVTPSQAGKYFNKIECFCFTEQTLKSGESQIFTMVFFLDSSLDLVEENLIFTSFPSSALNVRDSQ